MLTGWFAEDVANQGLDGAGCVGDAVVEDDDGSGGETFVTSQRMWQMGGNMETTNPNHRTCPATVPSTSCPGVPLLLALTRARLLQAGNVEGLRTEAGHRCRSAGPHFSRTDEVAQSKALTTVRWARSAKGTERNAKA